jgi:beta-glucanase (GH16 family)
LILSHFGDTCNNPSTPVTGTEGGRMQGNRSRTRRFLAIGTAASVAILVCATGQQAKATIEIGLWANVWTYPFLGPAGSGVDTHYWTYDVGHGIFGNNEIETMTDSPANVHLTGTGSLAITASDKGGSWTSGRIQTNQTFTAPAGGELAVSAAIEQPIGGTGYWPAFWMLGQGQWPEHGEIDIMEDVNSLSENSGTLHCGNLTALNSDGTTGPCHEYTGITSHLQPCAGCQTGYHVYTVIINRQDAGDEQISWQLDGKTYFTVSESQFPQATWTEAVDHGFSIIFDVAMGGAYPDAVCHCVAPTASTQSGGTMHVKYVSVQEWTPVLSLHRSR